jgi:hypothetical protein
MFAGVGNKIQEFKDWIRSNPKDASGMPIEKGMSVCMVHEASGDVAFQKHQDIQADNVLAAGSGSLWAFGCWKDNRCSLQAVRTAITKDNCSGGEVKYVDFHTPESNVMSFAGQAEIHIDAVTKNILQRGIAMKIQSVPTGVPNLPFKAKAAGVIDAANDEREARAAAADMAAKGQLAASAPCAGMHNDWAPEDRAAFKQALGKMFGWAS